MHTLSNAIGGELARSTSPRHRADLQPGDRRAVGRAAAVDRGRARCRGRRRQAGAAGLGRHAAAAPRPLHVPLQAAPRREHRPHRRGDLGRARQDPCRCRRRGAARHRGGRVRLRHPASPQGRVLAPCRSGDRHAFRPPAARRLRRHHAVQFPGDGADVDVSGRDRLRQHLRPEAVGKGPERLDDRLRALQGGGLSEGRAQHRPRRQGSRRRDPRPSRHQGGELRRLDPDRRICLPDRHPSREARPGAGRRQEPHGGDARRRHRQGGRRADGRRLRLRRRALHGDLGRRAGRRGDRQPPGRVARARASAS